MEIALIGYGKMGRMIEQTAIERGHKIVSIIDIDNPQEFNSQAFASANVAIEFTAPDVAYDNVLQCFKHGLKVVSGSTGWMETKAREMEQLCQNGNTLFWSSNFSLGVAITNAANKYIARLMNRFPTYDVHIEETHHIHKLDAPSGTAITLAQSILRQIDRKNTWAKGLLTAPDGTISGTDKLNPETLRIDSIRRDEVPGIHTIVYDSEADSITLTHNAHSRKGFALGAVLAAEFTATHNGLLTMDDLFAL